MRWMSPSAHSSARPIEIRVSVTEELPDQRVELVGFLPLRPMAAVGHHVHPGIGYLLHQDKAVVERHHAVFAAPDDQRAMWQTIETFPPDVIRHGRTTVAESERGTSDHVGCGGCLQPFVQ